MQVVSLSLLQASNQNALESLHVLLCDCWAVTAEACCSCLCMNCNMHRWGASNLQYPCMLVNIAAHMTSHLMMLNADSFLAWELLPILQTVLISSYRQLDVWLSHLSCFSSWSTMVMVGPTTPKMKEGKNHKNPEDQPGANRQTSADANTVNKLLLKDTPW